MQGCCAGVWASTKSGSCCCCYCWPLGEVELAGSAGGETLGKPASAHVSVTDGETDGHHNYIWFGNKIKSETRAA